LGGKTESSRTSAQVRPFIVVQREKSSAQSNCLGQAAQNNVCGLVDAAMHRRKRNHKMTLILNSESALDQRLELRDFGRDNRLTHIDLLVHWTSANVIGRSTF
jgi:hypothetical protein